MTIYKNIYLVLFSEALKLEIVVIFIFLMWLMISLRS